MVGAKSTEWSQERAALQHVGCQPRQVSMCSSNGRKGRRFGIIADKFLCTPLSGFDQSDQLPLEELSKENRN